MDRLTALPPKLILLIVFFLVCTSYANTLLAPPVFDDMTAFVENPALDVDDFSLQSLRKISSGRFGKSRFIPQLSFAVDKKLGKGSIIVFHQTNIFIHLAVAFALLFFIRALFRTEVGRNSIAESISPSLFAVIVCVLWMLNPVQTNAVTYLVQRMTSLVAFFYLVALTAYIEARLAGGIKRYTLFIVFLAAALCAVFSKENSYTLPLAILVIEWIFLSPDLPGRILRLFRWYHWLVVVGLIAVLLPLASYPWNVLTADYSLRHFSLYERLLTQPRVVVFYLSLLLLPLPGRMNLDHDFTVSTSLLTPLSTLPAIIFIAGIFIFGLTARRRYPLVSFGIIWFFLQLLIESTFIPLELVFEHRLYLPSLGFWLVIVSVCERLIAMRPQWAGHDPRKIFTLLLIIVTVGFAVITGIRNMTWQSRLTLTRDCAEKSPQKARAVANYGEVLAEEGRFREALPVLEHAIAVGVPRKEEFVSVASNIVLLLQEQDRISEAVSRGEQYWRQISTQMNLINLAKFMTALGSCYAQAGQLSEAFQACVVGLHFSPRAGYLHVELLEVLKQASNSEKNRRQLGLDGGAAAIYHRMAEVMTDVREYEAAEHYLELVRSLEPDNSDALVVRRRLQDEQGRNHEAEHLLDISNDSVYRSDPFFRACMAAVVFIEKYYPPFQGDVVHRFLNVADRRAPDHPFVGLFTVRWKARWEGRASAIKEVRDLIKRHPGFFPAQVLLIRYYLDEGRREEAAPYMKQLLSLFPGHYNWLFYENVKLVPLPGEEGALVSNAFGAGSGHWNK